MPMRPGDDDDQRYNHRGNGVVNEEFRQVMLLVSTVPSSSYFSGVHGAARSGFLYPSTITRSPTFIPSVMM